MQPVYAYLACATEGTVEAFEFDTTRGTLRATGHRQDVDAVRALAADPAKGLLYAGQSSKPPAAAVLRVDAATGAMNQATGAELEASTAYISLAPARLLSASYHQNAVHAVPLDAAGMPAGSSVAAESPGEKAHCVRPSPDGLFVYATALGSDRVAWYPAEGDGELKIAGTVNSAPGSGPRHLVFSQSGEFVYVLHEMSGEIGVHARNAEDGSLSEIQRIASVPESMDMVPGFARATNGPVPGPNAIWCADLRLGTGGRYLFTTERSSSTVNSFAVNPADGTLTYVQTTPTEQQPRGACVDPTGAFLLVCGEKSGHVSVYRINAADGSLEQTDRAETGAGPLWIEMYVPA